MLGVYHQIVINVTGTERGFSQYIWNFYASTEHRYLEFDIAYFHKNRQGDLIGKTYYIQ
jgi:hypothetical protein